MPRIHPDFLDVVVYLYSSRKSAEEAKRFGGSGFLVHIPSVYDDGSYHYYIVTNQHVSNHARAVRLNTHEGKTRVVDIDGNAWIEHPRGDDVAICPIDLDGNYLDFKSLNASDTEHGLLLTERLAENLALGVGDDVFLVGRNVNHAGVQLNEPTGRFGRISQMPGEALYQPKRSFNQISFVVDIPSFGGYSGSPVFLYPMKDRLGLPILQPWLLGVNWGHLPAPRENVFQRIERMDETEQPVDDYVETNQYQVEPHAGLAAVVPAWKIRDILDDDRLKDKRQAEDNLRHRKASGTSGGRLDER